MFVYGVCVGPSGRYGEVLAPSLRYQPDARIILRHGQDSIFDAYNSILDEACREPDLEGVVLVHEDVRLDDRLIQAKLRRLFSDPAVGIVGAVGGRGHTEMFCWKTDQLYGHVVHATHTDAFTTGDDTVDTVDGLLMALSPRAARVLRLNGSGYPGFHGYDSELCALARHHGMTVMVTDLDLFHDCKTVDWKSPELWWASWEWALRWRDATFLRRLIWRLKRLRLRLLARVRS